MNEFRGGPDKNAPATDASKSGGNSETQAPGGPAKTDQPRRTQTFEGLDPTDDGGKVPIDGQTNTDKGSSKTVNGTTENSLVTNQAKEVKKNQQGTGISSNSCVSSSQSLASAGEVCELVLRKLK